jgi:hypothetical protein
VTALSGVIVTVVGPLDVGGVDVRDAERDDLVEIGW